MGSGTAIGKILALNTIVVEAKPGEVQLSLAETLACMGECPMIFLSLKVRGLTRLKAACISVDRN